MSESEPTGICELCQSPAKLRCSSCLISFYCDKQHQREDWPKHRLSCFPYKVKDCPNRGPHIVAARQIKQDELIVKESPVVIGPRHRNGQTMFSCTGCCRELKARSNICCPRCKWPICSERCPGLNDPSRHIAECKLLATLPVPADISRIGTLFWELLFPLRCLLLQSHNKPAWKTLQNVAVFSESKQLDSHKRHPLYPKTSQLLINLAKKFPESIPTCYPTTTKRLFALLDVNSLDFADVAGTRQLAALYQVASLLEHNCLPNCYIMFEPSPDLDDIVQDWRGRVTVRATRKISKGEKLSITFTQMPVATNMRQLSLATTRGLRCSCDRCLDPHECGTDLGTLKCPRCPGWILPVNLLDIRTTDWKCNGRCGGLVNASEVMSINMSLFMDLQFGQGTTVGHLENVLAKFQKYLHPNHSMCITVKSLLVKLIGDGPKELVALSDYQLERKITLAKDLISVMEKLDPSLNTLSVDASNCLPDLARAKAEMAKRKYTSGIWDAERTIREFKNSQEIIRRAERLLNIAPICSTINKRERAKIFECIEEDKSRMLSWASSNGLLEKLVGK